MIFRLELLRWSTAIVIRTSKRARSYENERTILHRLRVVHGLHKQETERN